MRYIMTGKVLPERANIFFSKIQWTLEDGVIWAQCDASQLTVILDLRSIDGWATAYIAAEHFAMIIVGALGFSLGSGYSVDLIQVTEEDGTPRVFGVRPVGETIDETLAFSPHEPVLNRAILLATENIFFRLALRDFIRAINDPGDCPSYCFRAIESIKSAFEFDFPGREGWQVLHRALGTNKEQITETVKRFADPVRHGNWINALETDGAIRWSMLKLTRFILWKYLDLKQPEFPDASFAASNGGFEVPPKGGF